MSKEKDNNNKEREHHQGSIAAEDEELTEWLNRLWARNEPPERVELWQVFGKYKSQPGEMIHHEDFRTDKLDVEQVNKLANEILAAAQNDADGLAKESSYQLRIIDRNRKANPLVRRIGPLMPKRKKALAVGAEGFANGGDDEDEELDSKSLNYRYAKDNMDQSRWDKQRYDTVMGHMLGLYHTQVQVLQDHNQQLMLQNINMFERMQEAQDRSLDRELIRDKEKLKADLMKDGFRAARNLLPGLFAKDKSPQQQIASPQEENGEAGEQPKYGASPERTLVTNFLNDCDDAKLMIPLFGDYEEQPDGKAKLIIPGIFSTKQFYVLFGVSEGQLPPSALDNLMPDSEHKDSVTEEQLMRAQQAGVTEGIGMALVQVIGLRQQARAAANGNHEEMSQ